MFEDLHFFNPRATRKEHLIDFVQEKVQLPSKPKRAKNANKPGWDEYFIHTESSLPMIAKRKKMIAKIFKTIHKIETLKFPKPFDRVNYIVVLVFLQTDLADLISILDAYTVYGLTALVLYVACICVLTAPIFLVFFFLSNKCQLMSFKFWYSVPILKGIAFSMVIFNLTLAIYNILCGSLAVMFMFAASGSMSWMYCGYTSNIDKCYTIETRTNESVSCDKIPSPLESFEYSTQSLLWFLTQEGRNEGMNWNWVSAVVIMWFLILLASLSKAFIKTIYRIFLINAIIISIISTFIGIMSGSFGRKILVTRMGWGAILNTRVLLRISLIASRRVLPGNIITFSALARPVESPTSVCLSILSSHIVGVIIFCNIYKIALNALVQNYDIQDISCATVNGLTIIYAIIPDYLLNNWYSAGFVLPLYYFLLCAWGWFQSYYSMFSIMESLSDEYDVVSEHRQIVVGLLVLICCSVCVALCNNTFYSVFDQKEDIILGVLYMQLTVAFFVIFYTTLRIVNDYHFTFGESLGCYWKRGLKLYVMYMSCVCTGYTFFVLPEEYVKSKSMFTINIILASIYMLPILAQGFIKAVTFKTQKSKYLLTPDDRWGPPDIDIRYARRRFNPKRECRYKSTMQCNHCCLQNSTDLDQVVMYWRGRENYFYVRYHVLNKSWQVAVENMTF